MKRFFSAVCSLLLTLPLAAFGEAPALGDDAAIAQLPAKQWQLHDLSGAVVTKVAQITGENSPNRTQSRFGVWGTDLGSFTVLDGKTYLFGGDTFADDKNGNWRSNVLFIIEDDDPSDGLTITGAITNAAGTARELLTSQKLDGSEMTVIPTNLFAANGKLYCIYMSVRHWGGPGEWFCRCSGLAVSEDKGQSWQKLRNVKWPGTSGFIQTANAQVGDTMYFWGIPGGRFGGVSLMKAPVAQLEDMDAYAYYVGLDERGAPRWQQGEEGIANAALVLDAPVGELSVIYNEHLGNFMMTYLHQPSQQIMLRELITPWGPFGDEVVLARGTEYPALYGPFMHPDYVEQGGKCVYFTMSQYFPIYNIMWMRVVLAE